MEKKAFNDEDQVVKVAMEIVLAAGDAKTENNKALDSLENFQFEEARVHLEEAKKHISTAHNAQTDTIQAEMGGEESLPPCLLFNHAQDTLMTTMTEVNLTGRLITIFERFYNKMEEK